MIFFVIPVYNTEAYLARCVDSVLAQPGVAIHAILVDDGSTDGSGALCDRYAQAHPDCIEVIHKPNGGLSDARNAGLARCFACSEEPTHDFVVMLDSDDFLRAGCMERLLRLCEENGCDGLQFGWERGSADAFSVPRQEHMDCRVMTGAQALLDSSVKTMYGGKLYRLNLYEGERFPVGRLNEDEFVFYRLLWKCRRFAVTTAVEYYYFQREGSIMHTIARRLKDNPHRLDWRAAFDERIRFFEALGEEKQVQRGYERICTELILRYCEQMQLPRPERDSELGGRDALREYRRLYPRMIGLDTIRPMRRLMYTVFYVCPMAAVAAGRLFTLRR
ncbi:MAG: glycosyltransferase family 2 protein [Candidatus Ventricola sp.]